MGKQRVVVVEPEKEPYITLVGESYEAMGQIVKGEINMVYLGDGYCIFTNKQTQGLPYNRGVYGTFCLTKGKIVEEGSLVRGLTGIEANGILTLLEELYQRDLQNQDFLCVISNHK
ncbi:DUF3846 domain-containing protein [Alkalihalobacillus macyae]|uniref:DUF3846 domain-containing protein n=1 Tax=Guptibacillus hwajinpoensis TaxID=208199 RepID=UPI00273C4CB7|nr:DUF3846 domain-containing protein [Alkalihalobacillus macyae]MDP4552306.1 DUF3846 domain-containing protein [Alkalihalobacillus macyae]